MAIDKSKYGSGSVREVSMQVYIGEVNRFDKLNGVDDYANATALTLLDWFDKNNVDDPLTSAAFNNAEFLGWIADVGVTPGTQSFFQIGELDDENIVFTLASGEKRIGNNIGEFDVDKVVGLAFDIINVNADLIDMLELLQNKDVSIILKEKTSTGGFIKVLSDFAFDYNDNIIGSGLVSIPISLSVSADKSARIMKNNATIADTV